MFKTTIIQNGSVNIIIFFRDPNLWMVKCRQGEEKVTCLQLMRKFLAYQNTNEPLQIKSVVAPEGVKGFIYIEAYKQPHVKVSKFKHIFSLKKNHCLGCNGKYCQLESGNLETTDGSHQRND